MDAQQISINMRAEARRLGLCDEWYNNWGNPSIEEMLDMLKKGFDFYITHRDEWIEPSFIKSTCGIELLRIKNILADDKYSLCNRNDVYLLGNSKCNLRYNGQHSGVAWVLGTSQVEVSAKNRSHVIIEAFDSAIIRIIRRDKDARILVVLHGPDVSVLTNDDADCEIKYAKDYKV